MIKPPKFLFNHRLILKPHEANNAYGEKVYNNIDTLDPWAILSYNEANGEYLIRGRFEPTVTTSRSDTNEKKTYSGTLFILGTDLPTQSIIKIPGKSEKYIVSDVKKHYNLSGISYLEVLLK